ncbi:Hemin-binding periplasmic protein HmuT [bioreactor metagenome]|uniref:Hemin-binding periplasmic protein HmuT n=1 Tax=bioreactor metagenome TaxID=1076179 RepID=A0A645BZK1_9ZZZZ
MQAQINRAEQAGRRKPRALFILSHGGSPQVAGRGTAADALIRYAGAVNAINEFQGYRALTAEAMAQAAPDVIINSTQGIEALGGEAAFWKRPELALTPAFAHKALVTLEASHLLGFGPRLPGAVKAVHERMLALTA